MAAKRRLFLEALVATPVLWALPGRAQSRKVVGVLANFVPRAHLELGAASPNIPTAEFTRVLRDHGWEDGRNLRIVWRSAEGHLERLPALASELVRTPVDVIVGADYGAVAAIRATSAIPVVAASISNPVERGFAHSLARPGRNVTGVTISSGPELQKSLGWLKEAAPRVRQVAFVTWDLPEKVDNHPGLPPGSSLWAAAKALDVQLSFMTFGNTDTLSELVRSAARQGVHGFLFDQQYSIYYHPEVRARLAADLVRARMPAMHLALVAAEHGALMSHGADLTARWRRAAYFVDRILRGERPGDLPIEVGGKFELHLNLRAASAIGLTLPQTLLLQADRVFE